MSGHDSIIRKHRTQEIEGGGRVRGKREREREREREKVREETEQT